MFNLVVEDVAVMHLKLGQSLVEIAGLYELNFSNYLNQVFRICKMRQVS